MVPFSNHLRGTLKSNYDYNRLNKSILRKLNIFKDSNKSYKGFEWIDDLKSVNKDVLLSKLNETHKLLTNIPESKVVLENDWISLYTNSLDPLDDCCRISSQHIRIYKAELSIPRGHVSCRHSKHKYRIYLRHTLPTIEEHKTMKSFVKTYESYIFQSRSFKEWVADDWHKFRPSEYYFFFETNDEGLEHMLDLMVPGLKSRVCNIISNKYNEEDFK